MARYNAAVCRLCRREGLKLFLKGYKCYGGKCPVDKRAYAPGQHGQSRIKLSDYGVQLREKQKAKRIYSVLERQFSKYFKRAQKTRGVTGQLLLQQLERRLDNVVHRLGFGSSRAEARMMVTHRGIAVNGRVADVPSHQVKIGDVITVAKGAAGWLVRVKGTLEQTKDRVVPNWLQVDLEQVKGTVLRLPEKDDVGLPIQEQLIVELYSK